jgi:hypothetical protein
MPISATGKAPNAACALTDGQDHNGHEIRELRLYTPQQARQVMFGPDIADNVMPTVG